MINDKSNIHIQGWMMKLGLNLTELMIYATIYSFTNGTSDHCYRGSAMYLGERSQIQKRSVYRILNKLEKKGYDLKDIASFSAGTEETATLIFDEVDTGVSGRAAQKVAEKLRSVAKSKQVLCVTHLPQLAALANTHLLIAKEERNGRTYTTVTPLDLEGRKRELARIIGGANITETTLRSAEEMLLVN